jgi:hypothetical protein
MYIAHISDLAYDIYAIGETELELKNNMIKAFEAYLISYHTNVEEFVENDCKENLANYDNSVWNFLREYLGMQTYNIIKGYALGWE